MTLANQVTVSRICLIPVFVGGLMYYQQSADAGMVDERFRGVAIVAFVVASLSDALDGWIARRFNQQSQLGAILDPLADKGLILSALITLSWLEVEGLYRLPIWFLLLVLSRDILLVAAVSTLHVYGERVKVQPHWSGKVSTFMMMTALSCILLKVPSLWCEVLVWVCGVFTFMSLIIYICRGLHLIGNLQADHPGEHPQ